MTCCSVYTVNFKIFYGVHLFSNIFIFVSALSKHDFSDRMADNMKEEKVSIKGEMFSVENTFTVYLQEEDVKKENTDILGCIKFFPFKNHYYPKKCFCQIIEFNFYNGSLLHNVFKSYG